MNKCNNLIKNTLVTITVTKEEQDCYFASGLRRGPPTVGRMKVRSSLDFEKSFIYSKVTRRGRIVMAIFKS